MGAVTGPCRGQGNRQVLIHRDIAGRTAVRIVPSELHYVANALRIAQLSTHSLYPGVELSGMAGVGEAKARALTVSIVMQEEVTSWAGQRPQQDRHRGEVLAEDTEVSALRIPLTACSRPGILFTLAVPAVPPSVVHIALDSL